MTVAVGGAPTVGGTTTTVLVGAAVTVTGVGVAAGTVSDTTIVEVRLGAGVSVGKNVPVGAGVDEFTGVTVGVENIGAPNSLHPRSGAAPVNPVIGLGGTGSPLPATNWMTPLSMAGDPD